MKALPWIAAIVLASLLVRQLWPRVETETEFITLPSSTDTLTVTETAFDTIYVDRFRDRTVYSTDTLVLRDTVVQTVRDTLETLPPQWRLTRLQAGVALDSATYVLGDLIQYDDGTLTRVQTFEQYPVTLGPVTDIRTDASGIHVNFGEWPEKPKTCNTGCRLLWGVGGLAAGVILWEVVR